VLTPGSLNRLLPAKPNSLPEAIRIAEDQDAEPPELASAPLLATTRLLIERAAAGNGLKLTATGNLSRADVRALLDVLSWPDFDKASVLAVNKVLNEADVGPVEISRIVAQEAKLLRTYKGLLKATKLGETLMHPESSLALFRLLFTIQFWRINPGYWDRVPVGDWPQDHIGIALWCVSVLTDRWLRAADLVDVVTVPDTRFSAYEFDFRSYALESRVLRPLTWLGLMESRADDVQDGPTVVSSRLYRKTLLLDRLLSFDVRLSDVPAARH
jgi:hypothetical protein